MQRMGVETMIERYIAFDVETPNGANDRMSAIGISVIEDNEIVREFDTLINPETHFDRFNIQLTGITPYLVEDAPTFGQLWLLIEPLMSSGVLVAHNAPFDLGVLARCLRAYGIAWKPQADYVCTCRMSRACYPQLENRRLNTLCDHLGIALDHHKASSDAHACAEIFCRCRQKGLNVKRFQRIYDFDLMQTVRIRR